MSSPVTTQDADHDALYLALLPVDHPRLEVRVGRLQADLLAIAKEGLQGRLIGCRQQRNDTFSVAGGLPVLDEHVVAVEDSLVAHRVALDLERKRATTLPDAGSEKLLEVDLVPVAEGMRILPEDTREFARQVQALPTENQRMLLPRALLNALHRFSSTGNIQDVSTSTHTICESEAEKLESELAMIRYITWAIPSIGFIGTVRGIGEALAQADKAVQGDIAGVTLSLGVAFNSTFIALLISIFLMFLVHQLQLLEDNLVFDSEHYCNDKLIRHMKAD